MIFKTMTNTSGKTGIQPNNFISGLFNGDLFKKQTFSLSEVLSSSDVDAIKAYNKQIDNCVTSQTAFNRTMLNTSKEAQNVVAAANGNKVALDGLTKSSKAAELGMKALAMAGNMLLIYALTSAVEVIYKCATASDRLAESASQMGSEFASTKSDISDYKTKIEELYQTINDDTSSYEDTYNARQELLKIQDEMIDKFGDEADAVKLVTDAINGQTDSLDTLTQDKWQETVNAFNSDRGKGWTEKVADAFANIGHGNNFQRMIDEMENTEVTFHMIPMYGDDTYEEFSKKLKEDFGADITRTERDDAITLSGDLDTIYKQLLNIQTLAKGMGIDDTFLNDLGNQADEAKSKLDEYQEMYSQHVLYDKVFNSEEYEKSFDEINKAYEKYQDAFASGDEESIEKAKQNYAEIVQSATKGLDDQSVIDYFNNMYPDLQEVVGGWEFEVKFKAAVDDDSDDFEKGVQDAVSKFDTVEDIRNYNPKVATDEQKDAYLQLKQYADDYGLTLDQLIDKLVQLGLLQSQSKSDLLNKLIPSKSTPTAGVTSVLTDAMDSVDADEVEKWVDSLTDEEAKLANSPEFDKALEKQKEKINSIPESFKEAQENLENEYQKISDWGLDDYADQIKNGTIQSKFGNVDMDKRTIIHWSDELKQTYADALASWDYDPEVGSIDTVFGGSQRFGEGLNGNGWEIAFTPILPDGTFLSRDTVEEYINSILAEAYADDGKVTEDELAIIDAQGRQVGNTFVQGIFAGIDDSQNYDDNGNWAEVVGRLMHFSGDFGAIKLANDGIDEASKSMDSGTLSAENYSAALQYVKNSQEQISNETPSHWEISEDQSKAIDDFQSKVKTLSSALSTLQSGGELDSGTFTDLMQEFPSLSEESDNLEEAIKSLIEDALKKLYSTLGENLPDNYKNSLREIADEALNTKTSLKDALSDIQKSYDVMYDFKDAMSDNGITDSLLNSVASLSDELNTLVAGFYAGAVSAEQLFSAISEQYDTDLQNYSNALIEKNALNSEFYSNVGLSSTEVINHFRDDYGVDIENCKSYAALKAKIELETLGKIARKWSDYYDLQTQQLTEKAKYLQNQADHLSGNAKMKFYSDTGLGEMLNELEEESSRYQEMMDYINNITYEGIDSSFDKISTKLKKASNSSSGSNSSSKDSTTEIDWIQRKVDVLSDALDELKNKLDGALTSKEKRTILDDEIEKAKELRDVYTEGAKKYEDAANSYAKSNSSVLSKKIISKIQGGTSLSKLGIEDFSSENAEIVNNYIKLWDNYKEFEKLQTEIDNDIADYEEQKRQTVIDDFNDKYDLLKHNLEMGYISEKEYYVSLRKLNEKYYSDKEKYGDEYKQYEEEIYKGLESYYKSYCDDMMTYYQKSLEANKISFKKYSKDVAKFLKNMFNQGKISAKDYYDYLEQFYQEKKDIYDRVLSAVENRFDKEIDKIDEQIDKLNDSNDALEEQKTLYENAASAVVDYYDKLIDNENDLIDSIEEVNDNIQDQIDKYDSLINVADRLYEEEQNRLEDQKDAIQDKIDLINDENDAKDLQYRKEQALYELERSQQQRTKKVYVGDKGFIYDTDKSAISDAKKKVEDIRTDELISSLEKEKDALDDSIDALQKYRDALSEISDAYNKLVDERNVMELIGANYKDIIFGTNVEDWDKLKDKYISAKDEITDNENLIKSYEEKIKVWEKEKEQWSSLTDVISQQEREQAANQLLGANWKQQINNGVLNSFDGFKDKYLQIQSKINSNDELIESLNKKKSHYEDLKQQWSDLTSAYEDSVNEQYATSVLGANWESKILSGRLSTLNNFKDEYIKIQKEIANAQVQATQAQIKADTASSSKLTSSNSNVKKAQDAVEKARFLANKIINKKATSSHKGLIVNAYETGTKNAKKGINLVGEGESGAETYVDNHGNIALVTEPTLIPMEGGETVYNGEETKKMLSMKGLVPVESIGGVDINEITKQLGNMPFSMPNFDNKNIPKPSVSNVSNTQSVVIGDIHLHGVQNVPDFGKALKEALPGISVQFNGRH